MHCIPRQSLFRASIARYAGWMHSIMQVAARNPLMPVVSCLHGDPA